MLGGLAILALAGGGIALAAGYGHVARRLLFTGIALAVLGPLFVGAASSAVSALASLSGWLLPVGVLLLAVGLFRHKPAKSAEKHTSQKRRVEHD